MDIYGLVFLIPSRGGGEVVLYTGVYHIIGHVLQYDSDVRLASPLPPFWPLAISFDAIFLQLTCLLTVASIRFSINFYAAYRTQPPVRSCVIKTLIHFSLIESKKKKMKKKLVGLTFCRVICHDLSHGCCCCCWPICRCPVAPGCP